MQLTHYTDYGLRVLIFLSLQEKERRVTITDIAEHFSIPRNHLIKVVQRLSNLNYIHAVRGRNGGISLGDTAMNIRLGDVVRNMEANLEVIDCNMPSTCPILPQCRLKGILQQATDAFLSVLDQYTIADLQQSPEELMSLLHWQPIHNHSSNEPS